MLIACVVASVRHKKTTRYRFECVECRKLGKWTEDRMQARRERDEHNTARHGVK